MAKRDRKGMADNGAMTVHRNPLPQLVPQRFWRIVDRVGQLVVDNAQPVEVVGSAVIETPIDVQAAMKLKMSPVKIGEHFGPAGGGWHQRWFRLNIPAAKRAERGRRHLRWRCQGETTVYIKGAPFAGLDVGHATCALPNHAATLWLDCATWATGMIGAGGGGIGPDGVRFGGAEIVTRNEPAWQLHHDLEVLKQVLDLMLTDEKITLPGGPGFAMPLDEVSPLLRRLLGGIEGLCDAWVAGGVAAMGKASKKLIASLPAEWWQPTAALCGHAHIDLVYLWPEMVANRKAVHSFATAVGLLDRYPEVRFVQSMPAVYRAVERLSPALSKAIRRKIADGQWEVVGGFEVEPDVNLPSGEGLVRSLVYGNRKIAALAGSPSRVCWIPDVFGYSNCLPQILRLGGVDRFYTAKMSWSAITRFPYNSFRWQGPDGSEVLAHLCTTGYNGSVQPGTNRQALQCHRQADVHPEMLLPTGYGDGGGGITETMIERARRLANLAGQPRHRWSTADGFFNRLDKVRDQLPIYRGELYLEYHRGVQTSQAQFKRLYRACETALQMREAVRVAKAGGPIDTDDWLRVCFGQFHDALPGSAIAMVYEQLEPEYRDIINRQTCAATQELQGDKRTGGALVFNPLAVPRTMVVDGALLQLPALGTARVVEAIAPQVNVKATPRVLDNGRVRAKFNARGHLTALRVDGRDLLIEQPARFMLHHDQPHRYDAWDIDHYTVAAGRPAFDAMKLTILEHTAARAVLQGEATLGEHSHITVRYILEVGEAHLRIETDVDWQERDRLLRYALATGYRGRDAIYGSPFGATYRPQAPGTPSDEAMWECPGSRWAAALNDAGEGLAICTEAKFGFSCRDGLLGVSLLKSPRYPAPQADRGTHQIRFAIGAYQSHTTSDSYATPLAADVLFTPVLSAAGGPDVPAMFTLADLGSLCPTWVKPAETTDGYVIRLHETAGASGSCVLKLNHPAGKVALVDFNENPMGRPLRPKAATVRVDYRPYQIVSVLVER